MAKVAARRKARDTVFQAHVTAIGAGVGFSGETKPIKDMERRLEMAFSDEESARASSDPVVRMGAHLKSVARRAEALSDDDAKQPKRKKVRKRWEMTDGPDGR